jgi:hypothetical protein
VWSGKLSLVQAISAAAGTEGASAPSTV